MKLCFNIILQLLCFSLLGQKLDLKTREFSFSLGAVETRMEKFPANENLDFLNYYDTYPEYFDYLVVNLGYRFDFFSKMSADIKLIVMSDLVPDNYDISAYYHFNNTIGIGFGSMLNKIYFSNFEQFQAQILPDYYLTDENFRQIQVYDLGFYLTPMFKLIRNDRFQTTFKFDIGVSSFLKEGSVFYHKRKFANERLIYNYNTKNSFQPFINPKIEMRLQAFNINKTTVGLLLNSNFYLGKKSINYMRSIQRWTSDNEINELVKTPKHLNTRFETDFGLYVKW